MLVIDSLPAGELPPVRWRKSSASNALGNCVEVATLPGGSVAVRNSRDPAGVALIFPADQVAAFLRGVKNGEFDARAAG